MPRPTVLALGVLAFDATGVDVRLASRFEPSGPVLPHPTESALSMAAARAGGAIPDVRGGSAWGLAGVWAGVCALTSR